MTMETWVDSPVAQFAPVVWIAFAVAVGCSLLWIVSLVGMVARWHYEKCSYQLNFAMSILKLTVVWTIYYILNYFLGVISA